MAKLQCPRCGTLVDEHPGAAPTCPNCGFSGDTPPGAPAGAPPTQPPPMQPPPAAPYSTAPYSGGPSPSAPSYGGTGYMAPPPPGQAGIGYRQEPPTNSMAIASLVLSLVGLCFGLAAILGLIFGFIARKQIKERGEKGDGLALAGIIVGAVVIALNLLFWVFFFGAWMELMGEF